VDVFGISPEMTDIKATADAGIRAFRAWITSIGMPLTLKELGIPKTDLQAVIKRCLESNGGKVPGYMELDEKAVTEIFTAVVE
jgi:alcohol dehydrogenase YqhD (iron-dependent ADH family)